MTTLRTITTFRGLCYLDEKPALCEAMLDERFEAPSIRESRMLATRVRRCVVVIVGRVLQAIERSIK